MASKKEQQEKLAQLRREQAREELGKFAIFLVIVGALCGSYYFLGSAREKPAPIAQAKPVEQPIEAAEAPQPEPRGVTYQSRSLQVGLASEEDEAKRQRQLEEEAEKARENPPPPVMVD